MVKKQPVQQKKKNGWGRTAVALGIASAGLALGSPAITHKILRITEKMVKRYPTKMIPLGKAQKELYPKIDFDKHQSVLAGKGDSLQTYKGGAPALAVYDADPIRTTILLPGKLSERWVTDIRPGFVAHEMGHSVTALKRPKLYKKYLQYVNNVQHAIPWVGLGSAFGVLSARQSDLSHRQKKLLTGALIATPLLLAAPQLADEALASARALKMLKKAGYSRQRRLKEAGALSRAYGTYLAGALATAAPPIVPTILTPNPKPGDHKKKFLR